MWFWPVNEKTELVSGMPAPQFGRIFVSARIRAGSRFKRFLCFVFAYPRLETTDLDYIIKCLDESELRENLEKMWGTR
jgi:hypothetical protein